MTIKSIRTGWTGISALAGNDQWFSDFESIASVTVGAGGAANIEFTSIPTTYQHLQIRGIVKPASTGWIVMQFNGVTSSGSYQRHVLYGDGASAVSGWSGSTSFTNMGLGYGYSTGQYTGIVADILDYKDTNKRKTSRSLSGADNNGSGIVLLYSGAFFSSNAVSSIKIFSEAGNINEHSHFALYGIRG